MSVPAASSLSPTAMQSVPARHATPPSALLAAGAGVLCTVQLAPFHCSANVCKFEAPCETPTAVQVVAVVHDTPLSTSPEAPVALGVV